MKRLSTETIAKIQDLYEKGLSKYAIAKELNISPGSVNYHLEKRKMPLKEVSGIDAIVRENRLLKEFVRSMLN
jgi:orotate phosphoribosyltransferase-like protein